MKPGTTIAVTAGTLASLTDEQFSALRNNVLAEGSWDTAEGVNLIGGGDYLGVQPLDAEGNAMIYLGIERDGYTHS